MVAHCDDENPAPARRIGETYRLERLAAGDRNAAFETNEIDTIDLAQGGDGIVYTVFMGWHLSDLKERGNPMKYASSHQAGVQSVNANPQPGTQAWLDAKRGGPRWTWEDATGTQREGYMHKFSDRGGTDVSYFMHRDPGGQLDVVSGPRLKDAHTIPDHTVKK